MTAKRVASGFLAAGVLGILTGYLGVWIKCQNELAHGASYGSYQYTFLSLPALPGLIIAERISHGDWQLAEAWKDRHLIASANGIFWGGVASISVLLRGIFLRKTAPPSAIAD